MALRERAALAVLSGQPHAMALKQHRAEGERLGGRPIDAHPRLDRFAPVVDKAVERAMQVKALRQRRDLLADFLERRDLDAGLAAARIVLVARGGKAGPA